MPRGEFDEPVIDDLKVQSGDSKLSSPSGSRRLSEKRYRVRLVIIDPVSSYLGKGVDSHKNARGLPKWRQ